MTGKTITGVIFLLGFLLNAFFVLGATGGGDVGDWYGYVTIDSVLASNNVIVTAFINGSATNASITTVNSAFSTASNGTGAYIIHVPGTSADNVSFRVWNVNVTQVSQRWSAGDHATLNLSISKLADGSSCSFAQACSGGYCNSGTCASSAPSGAGSSTSSGVGGTTGGATATTVVEETKTISSVNAGGTATATITDSNTLKIQQINIVVKNDVSNVQITVKESSSAGATAAISSDAGATYKYLEISKVNIQDADIKTVKIKFKVEKSWTTSNKIDINTVALKRYSNSVWSSLPTTKLSDDANYYYFEAESPGLSLFAITGEKIGAKPATATTQPTTPTTQPTTQPTTPTTPTIPTSVPVIGGMPPWIVILIVVFIAVAAIVLTNKKIRKSLPLFGQ